MNSVQEIKIGTRPLRLTQTTNTQEKLHIAKIMFGLKTTRLPIQKLVHAQYSAPPTTNAIAFTI